MKTKISIGVAIFILLASVLLSAFASMSSSHIIAKRAIEKSQAIASAVGSVRGVVLVGVRQKLKPNWISCTTSTYAVFGENGFSFAVVNMSMGNGRRDWVVDAISLGWFGKHAELC